MALRVSNSIVYTHKADLTFTHLQWTSATSFTIVHIKLQWQCVMPTINQDSWNNNRRISNFSFLGIKLIKTLGWRGQILFSYKLCTKISRKMSMKTWLRLRFWCCIAVVAAQQRCFLVTSFDVYIPSIHQYPSDDPVGITVEWEFILVLECCYQLMEQCYIIHKKFFFVCICRKNM